MRGGIQQALNVLETWSENEVRAYVRMRWHDDTRDNVEKNCKRLLNLKNVKIYCKKGEDTPFGKWKGEVATERCIPDLVVHSKIDETCSPPLLVGDIKYRDEILRADLYAIMAYLTVTTCKRGMIIYPCSVLGATIPGVNIYTPENSGGLEICVIGLCLDRSTRRQFSNIRKQFIDVAIQMILFADS